MPMPAIEKLSTYCDFMSLPVDIHHYIYDSYLNVRDRATYRSISPFLRSLLTQQQQKQQTSNEGSTTSAIDAPLIVCCSHRAISWRQINSDDDGGSNLDYRYLIENHDWFCDSQFVQAESVLAASNTIDTRIAREEDEEADEDGAYRHGKLFRASCRECKKSDIAIHRIVMCTDYCNFNYKEYDTFAASTKPLLERITGWCPHTDIDVIQQHQQQHFLPQVMSLSSPVASPLQYTVVCLQCGLNVGWIRHRAPINGPYLYYWKYNLEWMKDSNWFESNADLIKQQIPNSYVSQLHPMFCAMDATKCKSCAWNVNNYANL